MSNTGNQDVEMDAAAEDSPRDEIKDDTHIQETEHVPKTKDPLMPSQHQQVELLKKKYGGLLPKKPPLISKDHEHAFFDSADWALGKQGVQKVKGPLEALRPKLEPTPHHHARSWRSTFAPPHDDHDITNEDAIGVSVASENDHACVGDDAKNVVSEAEDAQRETSGNP